MRYECPRCHNHFNAPVCPSCSASVLVSGEQGVGSFTHVPIDGEDCEALIVGIKDGYARVCVFGPGDVGHVSVRSYPLEEIT